MFPTHPAGIVGAGFYGANLARTIRAEARRLAVSVSFHGRSVPGVRVNAENAQRYSGARGSFLTWRAGTVELLPLARVRGRSWIGFQRRGGGKPCVVIPALCQHPCTGNGPESGEAGEDLCVRVGVEHFLNRCGQGFRSLAGGLEV